MVVTTIRSHTGAAVRTVVAKVKGGKAQSAGWLAKSAYRMTTKHFKRAHRWAVKAQNWHYRNENKARELARWSED